jgi:hypothetical protein
MNLASFEKVTRPHRFENGKYTYLAILAHARPELDGMQLFNWCY